MGKIIEVLLTVIDFVTNLFSGKYDTADKLTGRLQTLKDGAVEYPGYMAFASKGGEYFHGCRVAHFKSVTQLNEFFLPGKLGHLKLVCELVPQKDGSIVAVYTNVLSAEDREDVEEFSRAQHEYFREKKMKREMEKQAAIEKEEQDKLETLRLAEVGRKHEANCKKDK